MPPDWTAPGTQITVRPNCPPEQKKGLPRVWVGGVSAVVSSWDAEQVVFVMPASFEPGTAQPVRLIWGACEPGPLVVKPGLGGSGSGGEQGPLVVHVSSAGRKSAPLRRARIWLDGRAVGRTGRRGALKVADVTPGPHRITVQREGFESMTFFAVEGRRLHAALRPVGQETPREIPKITLRIVIEGACPRGEGVVRWSFTDPVDRAQDAREVPFSHDADPVKPEAKPEILIQNVPALAGGAAAVLMKCPPNEVRGGGVVRGRAEESTLTVRLSPLQFVSAGVAAGEMGSGKKGADPRAKETTFTVLARLAREEIPMAAGKGPNAKLTVPVLSLATTYSLVAHHKAEEGEAVLRAPGLGPEILASGTTFSLPVIPKVRRAGSDGENKGVLLTWDTVAGANVYHVVVARVDAQTLIPHWSLWVPAGTPTGPQAGVWIPLEEAPPSPEQAGVRVTAYASPGFSPQSFTEGAMLDRMVMAAQGPPVVLNPGQVVGSAPKQKEGEAPSSGSGASSDLSGVWVASWEGGPPLSTWIPALSIHQTPDRIEAVNLGSVFGGFQAERKDKTITLTSTRSWGGRSQSAMRLIVEVMGSGDGPPLLKGRAEFEEGAEGGSVTRRSASGVVFNRALQDPAGYPMQSWIFRSPPPLRSGDDEQKRHGVHASPKSKAEWMARVSFRPDGGFFAGGWEPSGGCGGLPCSAVIQLWEGRADGGLRIRVQDDSDRNCAVTMDFSGKVLSEGRRMTGKYSRVSCQGVQKGEFSAERR